MNIESIRIQFPELSESVYGKPLVYLDNAATAQRPRSVVDKWTELSTRYNANLHRAVYHIADLATEEYEKTRASVRDFINAASSDEIVFTSGTTASINLLAFSFGEAFLKDGDEVILTEEEHHSDIVPWQLLRERHHIVIKVLPVDDRGHLSVDALASLISPRTRLVCVTQVSNVLGLENPIKEIASICHSNGCLVFVDGAQGIVHLPVDVRSLDCDFYAFSGHKIYAAPGTGVLYGKKELLDQLPPFMGGGEMIGTVKWDKTTFAPVPHKFEAGTQNMSGVPTLQPALALAAQMRDRETEGALSEITAYMCDALISDPKIHLYGLPGDGVAKLPLFSFSVEHIHHEDLALILDKMGIAVRSGQMCAEPLMDRFGLTGMLRASFAPYNTLSEAEFFIDSLHRAIKMLE